MKLKRHFNFTLILLLGLFMFTVNVNAESINNIEEIIDKVELTTEEMQNLKNNNFPEDVIHMFTDAGYDYDKIMELEFIESETKYYKVVETIPNEYLSPYLDNSTVNLLSEEDEIEYPTTVEEINYNQFIQGTKEDEDKIIKPTSSSYTKTSYKRMTTTITKINNSNYKVSNQVWWSKTPKNRKNDIIGVGINKNTSPVPGTEYGIQTWRNSTGSRTGQAVYNKNSNKWDRGEDYGLYFKLKSNSDFNVWASIKMYMEYNITPNVSGVKKIDAYGHYAHQETTINIVPSFDILAGKLTITASQKKKFTIHPKTHVQINK